MKILKYLLIALVAIVLLCMAAFVVAGTVIPAGQSFENEVEINAPADKVWQVLNDPKRYAEWQTQITKVEMIDDHNWVEYLKTFFSFS